MRGFILYEMVKFNSIEEVTSAAKIATIFKWSQTEFRGRSQSMTCCAFNAPVKELKARINCRSDATIPFSGAWNEENAHWMSSMFCELGCRCGRCIGFDFARPLFAVTQEA